MEALGWSATKVAAECGVSFTTVWRWLNDEAEPRFSQYQSLRKNVPGFAKQIDRKAA